jgi:ribonuclease HI
MATDSIAMIWTDGASRGNPGRSGAGGLIRISMGNVVYELSEYLGIQTNNYAEYKALELTLAKTLELGIRKAEIFLDSKLVVEQLNDNWIVKNESLKLLHSNIKELMSQFESIKISHVFRIHNQKADELANKAIDSIKKC